MSPTLLEPTAPGRASPHPRRASRPWRWRRLRLSGLLYLLPAVVLFGFFSWYPIVRSMMMAFQKDNLIDPATWVGTENFRRLFADPLLAMAWKNTIEYVLLALVIGYFVPIFLAIAINEARRAKSFLQLAVYLPAILPPIVTVLLWKWFYRNEDGLLNQVLGLVGLPGVTWLESELTAMVSLVITSTWASAGATALFYLATLQSVRVELYEAAELDGAGFFRKVWHVTLPQMRFIMLVLLILQVVGTMQVFIEPYAMTGGGPDGATTTVVLLIFRYAFLYNEFGIAAALSLILAAVLAVLTAAYLWLTRRWSE